MLINTNNFLLTKINAIFNKPRLRNRIRIRILRFTTTATPKLMRMDFNYCYSVVNNTYLIIISILFVPIT